MNTLTEVVARVAQKAWVNKRGEVRLRVKWYPAAIRIAIRTSAAHAPPEGVRKGRDEYAEVAVVMTRTTYQAAVKKLLLPVPEDLELARGYVQLVRTLMGEKGDKVEVQYVGFK